MDRTRSVESEDDRETTALRDTFRGHPDIEALKEGIRGEVIIRLRDHVEDFAFVAEMVLRTGLKLQHLTETEMRDLLVFLHALTDPASRELEHLVPDQVPSGLSVED